MPLPPQTKYIVGNEACERFSFYGMRSILTLYMLSVLAMSDSAVVTVGHLFNAGIYVLPLIGAWLADRLIGRYRMILYVSLFYCLGHGILATADLAESIEIRRWILFAGLFVIALGAGGIKPCVSAFVGDQADVSDGKTMTRIYAAFYWSINLGSFFSFLVIPWVRQNWGYSWAFGIPGIFMALATFIFWKGRRLYRHREPSQPLFLPSFCTRILRGRRAAEERFGSATMKDTDGTLRRVGQCILLLVAVVGVVAGVSLGASRLASLGGADELTASLWSLVAGILTFGLIMLLLLRSAASRETDNLLGILGSRLFLGKEWTQRLFPAERITETFNLLRVLIVFLMIIPFWSLFDQTMSSWVLQGKRMQPLVLSHAKELHFVFGAEEMQSINPLFVMVLVPLVTLLIYPRIGRWASPLRRMGCGIVLAGVSYLSVAAIQSVLDSGVPLSILWQCIPYLVLTFSEILVSTTGLEYAYTAAGKNLKSIVSGFWFLTSTLGNFLIIFLTALVSDPASTSTFLIYAFLSVGVGLLFFFVTSRKFFKTTA